MPFYRCAIFISQLISIYWLTVFLAICFFSFFLGFRFGGNQYFSCSMWASWR